MTDNENTAAEYETRLARLLEERFGARQGGLLQRADKAALYLPADLARRLREMVNDIFDLKHGANHADPVTFRASAEATLASLGALPARSRWTGVRWHLLLALIMVPVGLIISIVLSSGNTTPTGITFTKMAPFLAALAYLYWAVDRVVRTWLTPSFARAALRALVALPFLWNPAVLAVVAWAVLRSVDWRSGVPAHAYGPGGKKWEKKFPEVNYSTNDETDEHQLEMSDSNVSDDILTDPIWSSNHANAWHTHEHDGMSALGDSLFDSGAHNE